MKKKIKVFFLFVCFMFPTQFVSAQNQFIFGLESKSGNFWSANFLGLPLILVNAIVPCGNAGTTFRFTRIKNNGEKMDYYGAHYFGFKAEDLFRDFEYSIKLGWQPPQIPVGFFARFGYRHENFNTRFSETDNWSKHRLNCFRPGLGIRISPLENLIDEYGWCPIIEIGSTYDCYFSYKGAYNDDKKQINNGLSTYIALGGKLENGAALMLTLDKENYDLFNQDFKTPNGLKPYENVTTSHFNIAVSISAAF